jgi:hypothetical protein
VDIVEILDCVLDQQIKNTEVPEIHSPVIGTLMGNFEPRMDRGTDYDNVPLPLQSSSPRLRSNSKDYDIIQKIKILTSDEPGPGISVIIEGARSGTHDRLRSANISPEYENVMNKQPSFGSK